MRRTRARKTPKGPEAHLRTRVYVVLFFFAALFGIIFARAFALQVLDGPDLQKMAAKQHRKTINIQSKRGDIYDRNLKELAVSIEVDSVYAQPGKIESPREAARKLAPILSMDAYDIEKKLKSGNFVWVKRQVDLSDEQRKIVAGLEGVGIMKEGRRFYPNRQLASHVVGFTGVDANGLEGIERHYDTALKGASRKYVGDKDAMGRMLLFEDPDKTVPLEGDIVELTIDKTIQYIAEKELKRAVESARAKGGMALVMDPMTGEILAMASQPTFDPNDLSNFSPKVGRNKPVTDTFEPGSTFKMFLISAALEENLIRPQDVFFCENGSYRVADRVFHDHEKHGWLDVPDILRYSSNICSAKIGEKLGKVQLYRYMKSFGFGTKTGVDLPGEAVGSLRNYKKWSAVTLHTVSFGQGVSVTGLQLTTALGAIANGGFIMKPYVVKSIRTPDGAIVSENHPTVVRKIISTENSRKMTEMLIGVTKEDGTGLKAAIEGFEVAGKTGTAQKPDLRSGGYMKDAYIASFFGYVPARDPKLAVLVAIDEPKGYDYFGGSVAAPAFREIAQQSLAYMGVFPENSGPGTDVAKVEPVRTEKRPEGAKTETALAPLEEGMDRPMAVPDFTGKTVRSAIRLAKERSFEVDIIGSGKAVSQKPGPGASIPEGGPVVVWFQ